MRRKLVFAPVLVFVGMVLASQGASASPFGIDLARSHSAEPREAMVQKVWHSGTPHRRIVGDTVYGGNCPPQGCPAWTQRDLRQDPYTGEWYSPQNERRRYYNPPPRRDYYRYDPY